MSKNEPLRAGKSHYFSGNRKKCVFFTPKSEAVPAKSAIIGGRILENARIGGSRRVKFDDVSPRTSAGQKGLTAVIKWSIEGGSEGGSQGGSLGGPPQTPPDRELWVGEVLSHNPATGRTFARKRAEPVLTPKVVCFCSGGHSHTKQPQQPKPAGS